MYWQMFGTCGKMQPDYSKLVIEQYTTSWEKLDGIGKYILCTDEHFTPTKINCHHIFVKYKVCRLKIKLPMINECKKFIFFPMLYKSPTKNTLQLNHYFSKSYAEFMIKVSKGSVATKANDSIRLKRNFFLGHEMNNICENRVIFRYLTMLKEQMKME